jgi:hypothetical protein
MSENEYHQLRDRHADHRERKQIRSKYGQRVHGLTYVQTLIRVAAKHAEEEREHA